jgi:hypothetical protein
MGKQSEKWFNECVRRSFKNYGYVKFVAMIDETNLTVDKIGVYETLTYKGKTYNIFKENRSSRLMDVLDDNGKKVKKNGKNTKYYVGYQVCGIFIEYDHNCFIYTGKGFYRKYSKEMSQLNENDIMTFINKIIDLTSLPNVIADKRRASVSASIKNPDKIIIAHKKITSRMDAIFGFKNAIIQIYKNGGIRSNLGLESEYVKNFVNMGITEI